MMEDVERLRAEGAPYSDQLARRQEYRNSGAAPPRLYYRSYVARDGAIVLGCLTKATRDGARGVLDMQHDNSDQPEFDSTDPETRRQTEVWMEEIEQKVRLEPVAYWLERFRDAGVPVAPVQFAEELADDPQVEAMDIMVDLDHEITGPQRVVGPIVSMSKTPLAARRAAPALGSHTTELLRELGLSETEINDHRANNIIGGE